MILTIVILLVILIAPFVYLSYQALTEYTSEVSSYELAKYLKLPKEKQRKYLINKYLQGVTIPEGYIIAFKGFSANMTCRGFKYKEGETYTIDSTPITCNVGFHACLMPREVADYYNEEDCKFHIVFLKEVDPYYAGLDSKKCAKTIKIGPRIPSDFIII